MPIYEYKCDDCGDKRDMISKLNQEAPTCAECGGNTTKCITNGSFRLIGAGFHSNDYARPKKGKNGIPDEPFGFA